MTDTGTDAAVATPKAPKDRSPSFPFIGLPTAIDRLIAFEAKFGRHPTPANKVGLAWGMKEASSQAGQTLAALKAFGMIDYQGSGPDRLSTITDDGRNYLRAQQDSVKREIAQRFARKPKLISTYFETWGAKRPIDAICLDQLVLKGNFTQSAAETFLRVYDATVAYAGLTDSDNGDGAGDVVESDVPQIEVGDVVWTEIGGQRQSSDAVRVRAVQEHQGKPFVFVDGEVSGIPMENVTLERKGATPPPMVETPSLPLNDARLPKGDGWKEERLLDDDGNEIFISYQGAPSVARYEFIRDYLDFKVARAKKPIPKADLA